MELWGDNNKGRKARSFLLYSTLILFILIMESSPGLLRSSSTPPLICGILPSPSRNGGSWKTTPPSSAASLRIRPNIGGKLKVELAAAVSSIKMIAESDEDMLRQMKDVAAARKRWDSLIREGKVNVLTPREAGYAIQLSDKSLLDVRPTVERNKAWVKGSTWIPIFDVEDTLDLGTLTRRVTSFTMGGWWSGSPTLSFNSQFLQRVEEKFPKDDDLIIACQKGLRSLAACELLYNSGYRNLFWVQGGLEAAEEEDLPREGPQPLKFAGIGGVSEFLGWTDQQRAAGAKEGWGYRLVFSARLVGVILVVDALFLSAQQLNRYLQEIRPH